MYFKDKGSTNIDSEFNNNNKFNFEKLKIPLIIVSVLVLIIVIILLLIKFIGNKNVNYFITLLGDEYITIYQDSDYIELGYEGYDNKGNNLTDKIKIKSTVDTSVSGKYEVIYSLGNVSVTRYVTVIEKPVGATYIYLKGDREIYLDINEEYKEPGYLVFDTVDSDLTNKVKVTNNVNVTKSGNYNIIYSVVNSSGVTSIETRTVIVMGSEISLSLNTKDYVNSSVTINVYVKDNYFNYLILPNGEKINQNTYSYKVEENGNYIFTSYNKLGIKKETSITVSNIDKIKPTGKCSGIYENEKTTINITADDNIGINKYVINGNSYTSDKITLNSKLEKANITIYDKAGNSTDISCSIEDKSVTYYKAQFSVNSYTSSSNYTFSYWLYVPEGATDNMPFIIFLHGYDELGNDYKNKTTKAIT